MVPPDALFGVIPVWVGVYALTLLTFAVAGYAVYRRVFRLVLQGRPEARFDRPLTRLAGAAGIVMGQRKVLQRVGAPTPARGGLTWRASGTPPFSGASCPLRCPT